MKHKLSKRIWLEMLVEDLLHIDTTLRPKLLQNIEDLDDTRYSSLLYLSLAVGVDKVLKNAEIWRALRSADYVAAQRSEEHTSELQSLMRNSYAVFCLKKNSNNITN